MTISTLPPRGKPKPYLGDPTKTQLDVEFYTGDAATHEHRVLRDYSESQSRSPGTPKLYFDLDNRRIDYERQYGLRFSFHNYTNTDLVIVDRMGLPVTIRPEKRRPDTPGVLIIRKEMYFDRAEVSLQAYRNVQSLGKIHGSDLAKMMPHLGQDLPNHSFGRSIGVEYTITEAEILAGDGRLYHLPTDMMISFMSAAATARHPCSPEYAQNYNKFIPNYTNGELDVRVVYRYISTDPKAQPKYVAMGNHVFMLRPELREPARITSHPVGKDKTPTEVEMTEYIELIYPAHLDTARNDVFGYRCHRAGLEQARLVLGVFDTLEDARNPNQVAEREKKQHKEELAAQAVKHGEQMQGIQSKMMNLEDDLRRSKITVEELKRARDVELEKIKEANEKETHLRRISSENVKLLTGIVAAVVTLTGLYLKYQSLKAQK